MKTFLPLLVAICTLPGLSPALGFDEATVVFYTKRNGDDVLTFNTNTKDINVVWSGRGIRGARMGPDGKQVIIEAGQKVVIASIDGSGAQEYQPDHWPPDVSDPGQSWDYSRSGLYWPSSSGSLYRFDPALGRQHGNPALHVGRWSKRVFGAEKVHYPVSGLFHCPGLGFWIKRLSFGSWKYHNRRWRLPDLEFL